MMFIKNRKIYFLLGLLTLILIIFLSYFGFSNDLLLSKKINSKNFDIEFMVTTNDYYYAPNILYAKKGEKVKLNLVNMEGEHDLVIEDFSVRSKKLKNLEEDNLYFVLDKLGTFEYYSSVPGDKEKGMVGKLIVQE